MRNNKTMLFALLFMLCVCTAGVTNVFAADKVNFYQYDLKTDTMSAKVYTKGGSTSKLESFNLMAVYTGNPAAEFHWETIDGTGEYANVYGRSTYDRLGLVIGLKPGTVKVKATAYVKGKAVASNTCTVTIRSVALSTSPFKKIYASDAKFSKLPTADEITKAFETTNAGHPRILADREDFCLAQKFITYANGMENGFDTEYMELVKQEIDEKYQGDKISKEYWHYLYYVNRRISYTIEQLENRTYQYELKNETLIDTVIKDAEDEVEMRGFHYRLAKAYEENVKAYKDRFSSDDAYINSLEDAAAAVTNGEAHAARVLKVMDELGELKDWNPNHFLDTGMLSAVYALGYDWCYDYMTAAQRTKYENILKQRGIDAGRKYLRSFPAQQRYKNNWSAVNFSGIGMAAIALYDQDPAAYGALVADAARFIPVLISQMAPDGAFSEGLSYWNLSWRFTTNLTSSMMCAFQDDYGIPESDGAIESMLFPIYMKGAPSTSQNFYSYNYGDTIEQNKGLNSGMIWLCNRYMDTREFADTTEVVIWYLSQYSNQKNYDEANVQSLLWFPPLLKNCGTELKAPSTITKADLVADGLKNYKVFRTGETVTNEELAANDLMTGFVHSGKGDKVNLFTYTTDFVDRNAVYFATKDSNTNSAHRDMDAGSFVYDALGTRWVSDWGKANYDKNRWSYYVKRAEGHSTIVINPDDKEDQNNSTDSVTTGTSVIESEDARLNANGGYVIYDMSNSYNVSKLSDDTLIRNNNNVRRGYKIFDNGKRLLIQDEMKLDQASDIYWFMQTPVKAKDFQIAKDGKSVILGKTNADGKKVYLKAEMKVTSSTPSIDPVFTAMKYETLSSGLRSYSENTKFAGEHASERKLAIHVSADKNGKTVKIQDCRIAVVLTPIYEEADYQETMPEIQALSQWNPSKKSLVKEMDIIDSKTKAPMTSLTMTTSQKATLATTIRPYYADNQTLSFQSSNTSVATVTSKGVISPKKCGPAVITVSTKDGSKISKKVKVIVQPGTTTLNARVLKDSPNVTLKIKKNAGVDEYHIYMKQGANGTYKLYRRTNRVEMTFPIEKGKITYYKVQCSVTTDGKRVYGELSEPVMVTPNLVVTTSTTKKVNLKNKVAKYYGKKDVLKYTSSNTKVATVTSNGILQPKKCGLTTITVSVKGGKGLKMQINVTVKPGTTVITAKKATYSKSVILTLKKVAGADEYHIYTSTSAKGTYKIYRRTNKLSMTFPLNKGTTYYKVQASMKVDGKRVYGDFSKPVKVK